MSGKEPSPITPERLTFVRHSRSTPVTLTVRESNASMGLYAMQQVLGLIVSEKYTLRRWKATDDYCELTYVHPNYEDVRVVYHGAPYMFEVVWWGDTAEEWHLHTQQPAGNMRLWARRNDTGPQGCIHSCKLDHPGAKVELRPVFERL